MVIQPAARRTRQLTEFRLSIEPRVELSVELSTEPNGTLSNRFTLSGRLVECQVVRYSPAGIALLNARLAHQSQQSEAGSKRQLEFEVELLFAGDNALSASRLAPGQELRVAGFVAPRRKLGKSLLFHVTEFDVF